MGTKFHEKLTELLQAIHQRDKKLILGLYDEINLFDFDLISSTDLDIFDGLIDEGNDILYDT